MEDEGGGGAGEGRTCGEGGAGGEQEEEQEQKERGRTERIANVTAQASRLRCQVFEPESPSSFRRNSLPRRKHSVSCFYNTSFVSNIYMIYANIYISIYNISAVSRGKIIIYA